MTNQQRLASLRQDLAALARAIDSNLLEQYRVYAKLVELDLECKALKRTLRVLRGQGLQLGLEPALAGQRRIRRRRRKGGAP